MPFKIISAFSFVVSEAGAHDGEHGSPSLYFELK
jgi:hypothetical protein